MGRAPADLRQDENEIAGRRSRKHMLLIGSRSSRDDLNHWHVVESRELELELLAPLGLGVVMGLILRPSRRNAGCFDFVALDVFETPDEMLEVARFD